MHEPPTNEVSVLLDRLGRGERAASEALLPLVYGELHALAARVFGERNSSTLQVTALVHEAYLKLLGGEGVRRYADRRHFLAVAATAMRQILIDHAREQRAAKRGGGAHRVTLAEGLESEDADHELLDLAAALEELGEANERIARVVEQRYLTGLSIVEVAAELGVSRRTVQLDWRAGRAWLCARLGDGAD